MNTAVRRAPIIFKNLHIAAEQIEQAAWSRLCWARVDQKRAQEYENEMQKYWKEMLHWKREVDKQCQRVTRGEAIENSRLYMG